MQERHYWDIPTAYGMFDYLSLGDYRILISMLKLGADSTDLTEWQSWLSPIMRLIGS